MPSSHKNLANDLQKKRFDWFLYEENIDRWWIKAFQQNKQPFADVLQVFLKISQQSHENT